MHYLGNMVQFGIQSMLGHILEDSTEPYVEIMDRGDGGVNYSPSRLYSGVNYSGELYSGVNYSGELYSALCGDNG